MRPLPDFSPAMLCFFLRARAEFRVADTGQALSMSKGRRTEIVDAFKMEVRRLAGVKAREVHLAWAGQLLSPGPRAALWAVLGHFPGDHGITLTHGGQEPC